MLGGVQQRHGDDAVHAVLPVEFRDADGIEIGPGNQTHLLLPVVDVDDFLRLIQIHETVLGGDVVDEVFVLSDIPDDAVIPEVTDIQAVTALFLHQLMAFRETDIGTEVRQVGKNQIPFLKVFFHNLRVGGGEVDDAHVGSGFRQVVDDLGGGILLQLAGEEGIVLVASADFIEAFRGMGKTGHADGKTAVFLPGARHKTAQIVHLPLDHFAVLEKHLSVPGKLCPLACALEQGHACFFFNILYNMAQLRLGNVHGFRRLIDGAVLCNGNEIFDIAFIHDVNLLPDPTAGMMSAADDRSDHNFNIPIILFFITDFYTAARHSGIVFPYNPYIVNKLPIKAGFMI